MLSKFKLISFTNLLFNLVGSNWGQSLNFGSSVPIFSFSFLSFNFMAEKTVAIKKKRFFKSRQRLVVN